MAEIPVAALELRLQKQVESAQAAFARGDDRTVDQVCRGVLAAAPGCLPVRKLQRAARLRSVPARPAVLGAMANFSGAPALVLAQLQLAKDPARALASAAGQLDRDPRNRAALALLGRAARALGWLETAAFAFEALHELDPAAASALVWLGEVQLAAGRPEAAVQSAEAALRADPLHAAAQALQRDASVALSLRQGNWEDRGDFRGKLKR